MVNTVEMVVSLSEDDRRRLDAIIDALKNLNHTPQKAEIQAETPTAVENTTVEETPVPDIVGAPTSLYTVKDVQQKVLELTTQKGVAKAAVREIVKTYADKVQNIPEDKLDEVMQKLNALEG